MEREIARIITHNPFSTPRKIYLVHVLGLLKYVIMYESVFDLSKFVLRTGVTGYFHPVSLRRGAAVSLIKSLV